jgi:hypothetical protein
MPQFRVLGDDADEMDVLSLAEMIAARELEVA